MKIVLRTERGVEPYYEVSIPTTKMEVFADRVEVTHLSDRLKAALPPVLKEKLV